MRVLIDALPARRGGGALYVSEQLKALANEAHDIESNILLSPWAEVDASQLRTKEVPLRSVPQRYLYELVCVPMLPSDIIYCPLNFGPIYSRQPTIVAAHNANYYGAAFQQRSVSLRWTRAKARANHAALKSAAAVVAVSQSLADDIARTVPKVAHKLHVIYNGAPTLPVHPTPLNGLPEPFLLTIGNGSPHKRVTDVAKAWATACDRADEVPDLVIVGSFSDAQRQLMCQAAGRHVERVHYLGYIGDRAQLRWLYEQAVAFVLTSSLESFSFTPLEAASVGCPLILSDLPVHREVTNGRAHFVDVGDIEGLADLILWRSCYWGERTPWTWPHTWAANAAELAELFRAVASRFDGRRI